MKKRRIFVVILALFLAGCPTLPSKEKLIVLYQREHPERQVIHVEQKNVTAPGLAKEVWFEISYITATDSTLRRDTWKYYPVAEGMVRSGR